jgi:hypothetical protein
MALVAAGVLVVVATLLHPSRETATTIVASEPQLLAAHFAHACLVVGVARPSRTLCGLPREDGTTWVYRFFTAFFGTYLIAVTGSFGFLARSLPRIRRQCWNNSMARTRNGVS